MRLCRTALRTQPSRAEPAKNAQSVVVLHPSGDYLGSDGPGRKLHLPFSKFPNLNITPEKRLTPPVTGTITKGSLRG